MSFVVHNGDCREIMAGMEPASVDSIVTDPPYGLSFMGKGWDHGVPGEEFWQAARRVAKPGAFLLAFGGTRTFHRLACAIEDAGWQIRDCIMWVYGSGFPKGRGCLKPAWEPVIVARKPGPMLPLQIDSCRVGTEDLSSQWDRFWNQDGSFGNGKRVQIRGQVHLGRWPANLIHDGSEEVLAGFPYTKSGKLHAGTERQNRSGFTGPMPKLTATDTPGDSGCAARFFYCAKASREDREANNTHPTVKPHDLMRYLCRLVTPPGGTVLDPFMGSGSTGKAAVREGFRFVGIELEPEYLEIAEARIRAAAAQGRLAV